MLDTTPSRSPAPASAVTASIAPGRSVAPDSCSVHTCSAGAATSVRPVTRVSSRARSPASARSSVMSRAARVRRCSSESPSRTASCDAGPVGGPCTSVAPRSSTTSVRRPAAPSTRQLLLRAGQLLPEPERVPDLTDHHVRGHLARDDAGAAPPVLAEQDSGVPVLRDQLVAVGADRDVAVRVLAQPVRTGRAVDVVVAAPAVERRPARGPSARTTGRRSASG